ncbi:MAG: ATP-binding protein [Clostridiales bacterium]|nr:ATP-binding protein [Clostridiales bacterium]
MRYSLNVYNRAESTLNLRRIKANETHDFRLKNIKKEAPEISRLNDSLRQTTVKLTHAILSGKDNSAKLVNEIRENNLKTQDMIHTLLDQFGFGHDYLDMPFTCKKCRDTGYVDGYRCNCFNDLLKKYAVEELNAKSKIVLHDFNEFRLNYYPNDSRDGISPRAQMQAIFNYCTNYTKGFSLDSPSMIFIGGTGLGKTFLSSAIAKDLSLRGFSVIFDSIQNILRDIENEHFGRSDGNTTNIVLSADLLILDDLGSEFSTSFNTSVLYHIINDRINSKAPTIISTNYSNSELNQKYDERIISRISSFYPMNFLGRDIRQLILKGK